MVPSILIVVGRLSRSDWVVQRVAARTRDLAFHDAAFYNPRQLNERINGLIGDPEVACEVLLLEARMAAGEVYETIEGLKSSDRTRGIPIVVVSADVEGADRIARGYIFGMAREGEDAVAMRRFSKRIAAPSDVPGAAQGPEA